MISGRPLKGGLASCQVRHDVTALPSRMTYRTPSINDAHLGLLTVRPLVNWIVTRCAWKQLRGAEWNQQGCWVDRRYDSCCEPAFSSAGMAVRVEPYW